MAKPKKEDDKQKVGPWDFIKMMEGKGTYDPAEHNKKYSPFLMSRILSTDTRLVPLLNRINIYDTLEPEIHFQFCKSLIGMLPNRVYSAYVREGLSIKNRDDKAKDAIMLFFQCGTNDYREMVDMMTDEEIDQVIKYVERNHLGDPHD